MSSSSVDAKSPGLFYRPDIDGLRALAVLAVVLFHAYPKEFEGGFLGVDVFFVISGYLISLGIIRELAARRFSISSFYKRRIVRIFPALSVVLIFCLAAGQFLLLADEYASLGKHAAAGTAFISNLVLWKEAGYFDPSAELKPLLHLWSLGIEEQFYMIWPLFLFLCSRFRLNLGFSILGIGLASFLFTVSGLAANPVTRFYLLPWRFWELTAGALLAYLSLLRLSFVIGSIPTLVIRTLRNVASISGLSLILYSIFYFDSKLDHPGWFTGLPVLGAALLLGAGKEAWINRFVLQNRIFVYFGLISYPLYLWHWPLLSFARIIEAGEISRFVIPIIALSLVLAHLTYYYVEKPIRFASKTSWITPIRHYALFSWVAFLGVGGYVIFEREGLPDRSNLSQAVYAVWPKLPHSDICRTRYGFSDSRDYCFLSNPSVAPNIILIGDSHAYQFFGAVKEHFEKTLGASASIAFFGRGGCPPFAGVSRLNDRVDLECSEAMDRAIHLATTLDSAKTILMAGQFSSYTDGLFETAVKTVNPAANDVFERAALKTLKTLSGTGKKVIVLLQVPQMSFDPRSCPQSRPLTLTANHRSCRTDRVEVETSHSRYMRAVASAATQSPRIELFDPKPLLCGQIDCPGFIEGKWLYYDKYHLNPAGVKWLGARFHFSDEGSAENVIHSAGKR